jgi:hypothetical protein
MTTDSPNIVGSTATRRSTLDAGDDGQGQVPRRRDHLVEDPVDAVPHLELVLKRLEVDVGRLVLDRLEQHEVDQPHDLVVLGGLGELFKVDRLPPSGQRRQLVRLPQLGHDRGH